MLKSPALNAVERLILLLLRADRRTPVPGPLFLQKEAYALRAIDPELKQDLAFEPHLLGPFSDSLAAEAEQLELSGLITSGEGRYRLTDNGLHEAELVSHGAPKSLLEAVEQTKGLLNNLSRDELLAIVYFGSRGEGFEEESVEYRRVLRERRRIADSLLRKGKVSIGKAAEIAGVGVDEILSGPGGQSG